MNVYLPDALADQVRDVLDTVNVSAIVQEALRDLIDCGHGLLTCSCCGVTVDGGVLTGGAVGRFYSDLLWEWQDLVDRQGTAEGAARIAKTVALAHCVPGADRMALPRSPRRRAS